MRVQDGNPVFDPAPLVLASVRLDTDEQPRPEMLLKDFELCIEVRRLMTTLDELKNGVVERIDVRAGLPCRITFESRLAEMLQ